MHNENTEPRNEQILPSELEALRLAEQEFTAQQRILVQSEGALRFMHGLLAKRYNLGPRDTIDAQGTLHRAKGKCRKG